MYTTPFIFFPTLQDATGCDVPGRYNYVNISVYAEGTPWQYGR